MTSEDVQTRIRVKKGGLAAVPDAEKTGHNYESNSRDRSNKQMPKEDVQTRIRVHGGGLEAVGSDKKVSHHYDSDLVHPKRDESRYHLSSATLGYLERLAKAQFVLYDKVPGFESSNLNRDNPDVARSVIRGVFASSEIEGEGISAEFIEAFVAAHTQPGETVDEELKTRLVAHEDIIETYWWLFSHKEKPFLSYEMILEAHSRMFGRAKPEDAGKIKNVENIIRWRQDGKETIVSTVAAKDAEEFLRALCRRTNRFFEISEDSSEASMILAAGEFSCDFLAIHPFADGNGRLARLVSAYLLERAGYHFSSIYPFDQVVLDSRNQYYKALNTAQHNWHELSEDLSPWMNYYVGAVFEQWERAFRRVRQARIG